MFGFERSNPEDQQFQKRLSRSLGTKVELNFEGDGVRRILIEPTTTSLKIRLDPLFRQIDNETYPSLVRFIKNQDESHKAELIEFLKRVHQKAPPKEEHPFQHHLDQLRHDHFPGLPPLTLIWGKEGKKGEQKTIRLASYWAKRKEIRLHPYLEVDGVPEYYLQYLLFHELCHAYLVMSGQAKDGEHHGPDFMKLEKKFPLLHQAIEWEEFGLPKFLELCKQSRLS